MKKRILITGVNGFIGQAMWKYVTQNYLSVKAYGIDRKTTIKHHRIFTTNLNNRTQFKKVLASVQPEIIFHLAGGRMIGKDKLIRSNVHTTKLLLDIIQDMDLLHTRVMIPGSAAEYGRPSANIRRISERYPPKPLSDYGRVKWDQTKLALSYKDEGLDIVVARIFNILGSNTPEQLVTGRFAKQIVGLEKKNKSGTIKTMALIGRRDFLDVEDVCQALWCLAVAGKRGHIYNVCSSVAIDIEQLLESMILSSKLVDVTIAEEERPVHKSFDVIGSNAKLKRDTAWRQKISFEDGIHHTLASWRKYLK